MGKFLSTPKWLRDFQFLVRRLSSRLPNQHFSNFGEQQIIDRYIDFFNIRKEGQTVVDIGAGDGIRRSNTYHLFSNGWSGLGIEGDDAKFERLKQTYSPFPGVAANKSMVSPDNVSDILASHSIETEFGVLSLDIDGNDYWVLDAILSKYRPKLIVSEYNEKIPPPIKFTVKVDPEFQVRQHFYGFSIAKLDDLLEKYDYALLEVEYNNVFLAPIESPGVINIPVTEAYREGYRDRPDRKAKFPDNANLEIMHSLEPDKGIEFLDDFYKEHVGKYQIGL